jgi:hypothetical protein
VASYVTKVEFIFDKDKNKELPLSSFIDGSQLLKPKYKELLSQLLKHFENNFKSTENPEEPIIVTSFPSG